MGISRTSFSAQSITENTDISIEMLSIKPDTTKILSTAVRPSTMFGYYNDAADVVELYLSDSTGKRFIRVG
jgi:hypothetical protein